MSKESCLNGLESLEKRLPLTNDPLFTNQWALSSMSASEAWKFAQSTNKPIVAIIDSGVDLNHPDIKNNIWINSREIANDKIDNDKNGYVDDINGWNFVSFNNKVQDDYYHGTVIAGIVGAVQNNSVGIAGVAPEVRILPIKFQNSQGLGYSGVAAAAINYVSSLKERGENIVAINISWTAGQTYDITMKNALQRASNNNIVIVQAAGNNGVSIDSSPRYPVSYGIANSISVASINKDLSLAGYSNYGKNSVNIAAQGSNILSTLPNSRYGEVSGTTFAAAQVSGAVAFLKSIDIRYSASQIKKALLDGASYIAGISSRVGNGVLNLLGAVKQLKMINLSTPVVPSVPIVPPSVGVIQYRLDFVNSSRIRGWANNSVNVNNKMLVEVSINNVVKHLSWANLYRSDTKKYNGFDVSLSRKQFVSGWNLVSIKIKDTINKKELLVYSNYMRI